MKVIKCAMLVFIVGLLSCEKQYTGGDYNSEMYTLEKLDLSPETLEFFDFYEKNDQLIFKKELIREYSFNEIPSKLDLPSTNKSIANSPELWVFNKVEPTDITYRKTTRGHNYTYVEGLLEQRTIKYIDDQENILEFQLRNCSAPNVKDKTWDKMYEFFKIRYNSPCWDTYLKYKTKNYITNLQNGNYTTIKHAQMKIGNTTYNDVMQYKEPKPDDHFGILATVNEGIVKFVDQDDNINWVLK